MLSLRGFTIVLLLAMVFETLSSMQPGLVQAQQDILQIVKISSEADSAVILDSKGQMRVIHPGDRIKPYGRVLAIFKDRIALKNKKSETIFINIANGQQTVQRVGKVNKTTTVMQTQISIADDPKKGPLKSGVSKDAAEGRKSK